MFINKDQREIQRKLWILRFAEETGHAAEACRYFGIGHLVSFAGVKPIRNLPRSVRSQTRPLGFVHCLETPALYGGLCQTFCRQPTLARWWFETRNSLVKL